MKNVIKNLLLSWICVANTCGPKESEICHKTIRFSNDSKRDVRVNMGSESLDKFFYTAKHEMFKVKSSEQENSRALSGSGCIEHIYKDAMGLPRNLYVFDAALIEKTSWDVVVRDNLVLKRYELSLEDLQRLNWRITYPPTELMKDIKQDPPYGK